MLRILKGQVEMFFVMDLLFRSGSQLLLIGIWTLLGDCSLQALPLLSQVSSGL